MSDSQPQPGTGTTSTGSSQNLKEKLTTILGVIGIESIRRGMKAEDDHAQQDALAYHILLHDKQSRLDPADDKDDGMGHIVLGDMKTEHVYPQSKGLGTLAKLAIGAGLIGTGAGVGAGIPLVLDALKPQPGETRTIEKVIDRDWKLGTPVVE